MHANSNAMVVDANDWRAIDRELRSIAKRQRALDAEEAALLCVVARQQTWLQFGCATILEYLELIFGYGPKVGHDRVRVAIAIDTLPELRDALVHGEVSYSALRELTRVVTPKTQREWLDAVRGKSVRQVEELVRTHRKGDLPTDPADPDLKPRRLSFEVSTATDALLREARKALANERGRFIEDDEFLAAMATAILEGASNDNDQGRAKFQVRVTTCDACAQTFFEGGGRKIAVTAADAARVDCDAQRIGADERAAQDIPPRTRREVIHRDGGKCAVPRCRSARFTEIHHIVPRSKGGNHDASNLCCLCDGHHKLLHEGKLRLSGRAPNIVVRFANDPSLHVETHVASRHAETKPNAFAAAVASVRSKREAVAHIETPHVETQPNVLAAKPERLVQSTDLVDADSPGVETTADPVATLHVRTKPNVFAATVASVRSERSEPSMLNDPAPNESSFATSSVAKNPHVGTKPSAYLTATMRAEAKQALVQLGFPSAISTKCVDAALASEPAPITLENLIRVALQHSR